MNAETSSAVVSELAQAGIYQALLESMTEGVSLAAADGTIIYTNRAEDRMFGYLQGELIGQHVSVQNAYPEEEDQRRVEDVIEKLKVRGFWEGEWRNRRKDGSEFTTASRISAVDLGGAAHWLCVQRDVTEQRQAEAALWESQRRLDLSVRAHGIGVFDWYVKTGQVVWSEQEELLFGLEPGTFEGDISGWAKRVVAEDLDAMNAAIAAAMDAGKEHLDFGFRIWRPDGEIRQIEGSSWFLYDDQGRPERMVGTNMDVTERKLSEERLLERQAMLANIVDQMPIGVIIARVPSGEIEIYNRKSEELMGHPVLGAELGECGAYGGIHADGSPYAADEYPMARAVLHGETVSDEEVKYRRGDGKITYLSVSATRILGAGGEPDLAICTFADISEHKHHEEHQRLLINELNHRVKNTLATVQGIAQQSFRGEAASSAARGAFEGRLSALSAAHNVLTGANWKAASVRQIVSDAVAPCPEERFTIQGCDLELPPRESLSLALALHELLTNAVKYGALSNDDGRVGISWASDDGRFRLEWRESGGPAVAPRERSGFGTRMIERALPAEMGGTVSLRFPPEGVIRTLDCPLPAAKKVASILS